MEREEANNKQRLAHAYNYHFDPQLSKSCTTGATKSIHIAVHERCLTR